LVNALDGSGIEEPLGAAAPMRGRIIDADAHVMPVVATLADLFPEGSAWLEAHAERSIGELGHDDLRTLRAEAGHGVWRDKSWLALGAFDASERLDALDQMGIAHQLVFPPLTLPAQHRDGPEASAALRRYTDFATEWAGDGSGRIHVSAPIPMYDVADSVEATRHALDRGAAAIELSWGRPPAGLSPADPSWDRLWASCAEAQTPVVLHIGGGGLGNAITGTRSFLDAAWANAPSLRIPPRDGATDLGTFGPLDVATIHLGAEVFLGAMVLGGVLQRHPALRIGVFELAAQWVAPWVRRLDAVAAQHRHFGLDALAELPSTQIRRHVRVTPTYGEPIAALMDDALVDGVLVFGSDYPHLEGGRYPMRHFAESLEAHHLERFFRGSALDLLPALASAQ